MGAKKKPQETLSLGRPRCRRGRGRRGGLPHRGLRARRAAAPRRHRADRGRGRRLGRADPRVSAGAQAHLMATLVYVEHHDGAPAHRRSASSPRRRRSAATSAQSSSGSGVRDLAEGLGRYGASKVYVADDPSLADPLPQPRVDVARPNSSPRRDRHGSLRRDGAHRRRRGRACRAARRGAELGPRPSSSSRTGASSASGPRFGDSVARRRGAGARSRASALVRSGHVRAGRDRRRFARGRGRAGRGRGLVGAHAPWSSRRTRRARARRSRTRT